MRGWPSLKGIEMTLQVNATKRNVLGRLIRLIETVVPHNGVTWRIRPNRWDDTVLTLFVGRCCMDSAKESKIRMIMIGYAMADHDCQQCFQPLLQEAGINF